MELSQAQQWLTENKDTQLGKMLRRWIQKEELPYSLGDLEVIEFKEQGNNKVWFSIRCINGNTAQGSLTYF